MSFVTSKSQCPRCADLGKDLSQNNLANYDDGHSYCFGCHYYKRSTILRSSNLSNQNASLPRLSNTSVPDFNSDCSYVLQGKALAWLASYGITPAEQHNYGFWYNNVKDLLVMPVYNGSALISTQARYFGPNPKHPKYLTYGTKTGYFKLFPQRNSSVYVLVEDYISAIKVGRQYNCIPLFGCLVPRNLILSLVSSNPTLRLWLDPDKAVEAIAATERARQFLDDCGTILSAKDPKDYPDNEIKAHVEFTLSDPEKLSRIYSLPEV